MSHATVQEKTFILKVGKQAERGKVIFSECQRELEPEPEQLEVTRGRMPWGEGALNSSQDRREYEVWSLELQFFNL